METVIRVAIVYVALLAGLRVLGKREFSELTAIELVSLLLVSQLVSPALQRQDYSLTNAAIAVATLFILNLLGSVAAQLSDKAQAVIEGTPTVLVHEGRLIEAHLRKERVTPDEIATAARMSGLEDVSQAKWAILEPDGKISIVPQGPSVAPRPQRETRPPGG